MDEKSKEMIQDFSDMVNATERLAQPWQEECDRWKKFATKLGIALSCVIAVVVIALSIVLAMFIHYAYTEPETSYQVQDFDGMTQSQSSGTETVTNGN